MILDIATLVLLGTAGVAATILWPSHAAADVAVPVALIVLFVIFRGGVSRARLQVTCPTGRRLDRTWELDEPDAWGTPDSPPPIGEGACWGVWRKEKHSTSSHGYAN